MNPDASAPQASDRPAEPRFLLPRIPALILWFLGIVLFSIGFVNAVFLVAESAAALTAHQWFRVARVASFFAMCECGFFARLVEPRNPVRSRKLTKATHLCFALSLLFFAATSLSRPGEE
ncbi:MAG: hypothetical protein AB7G17_01555 [Phycisphaerales bacterium]